MTVQLPLIAYAGQLCPGLMGGREGAGQRWGLALDCPTPDGGKLWPGKRVTRAGRQLDGAEIEVAAVASTGDAAAAAAVTAAVDQHALVSARPGQQTLAI